MKEQFTWVPFYKELAEKLLTYKNNRKELVDLVFNLDKQYIDYIHLDDGSYYTDLDPFTIFGIFNRKITDDKRLKICEYFKEKFQLNSNLPTDFDGVPVMHPQMSIFVWREYINSVTPLLWDLFELALANKFNHSDFIEKFNLAIQQKGIHWNITIGLFWINPMRFISLDGKSREYLPKIGIKLFSDKDFDGENYLSLIETIKDKINNKDITEKDFIEISNNAWKNISDLGDSEIMENVDCTKYINLLKKNKNIILHGAPGTGKTYLAKQIAKEMGCREENIGFVQFHPSYDYTDFVEGLRPTSKDENGNILFERKDGVFKEFCKNALENIIDSEKSIDEIQNEKNIEENFHNFIQTSCEQQSVFTTKNGNEFKISSYDENKLYIEIPKNEIYSTLNLTYAKFRKILNSKEKLENVTEIRDILRNKVRLQEDSYYFILCNEFKKYRENKTSITINDKVKKDIYVFIIDEINRGELSKIFGDLFFSIDPGYRGKIGLVQTQYQNLIESEDDFYNGFYIPENVYIIGTMNDIDRSVESMDFAMRRRFAFIEVTAEESADNMGLSEKSRNKMNAINQEINKIDGLNKSYNIGGAYFIDVDNVAEKERLSAYEDLWKYKLEGLVREYLRGIMATDEQEETLNAIKSAYDNAE